MFFIHCQFHNIHYPVYFNSFKHFEWWNWPCQVSVRFPQPSEAGMMEKKCESSLFFQSKWGQNYQYSKLCKIIAILNHSIVLAPRSNFVCFRRRCLIFSLYYIQCLINNPQYLYICAVSNLKTSFSQTVPVDFDLPGYDNQFGV